MPEIPGQFKNFVNSKVSSNSRYYFTPTLIPKDNNVVFDLFEPTSLLLSDNYEYYIVEEDEKDRLDLIAYRCYNNPSYWWIIAMANNMIDPFVVVVGTRLRIPNANNFIIGGSQNK